MWTTPEEAQRFQQLSEALRKTLEEDSVLRGEQRVDADDLALYLEWLELAREAAGSLTPFMDKSSPYVLYTLTYRQMESDFRWLRDHVAKDSVETDEIPPVYAA